MNPRVIAILGVVCLVGGVYFATQGYQLPQGDDELADVSTDADAVVVENSGASDVKEPGPEQTLSVVDRKVPAFELPELDDALWTPESLKGKPWVINFWATWCPPCIEEIPSMNAAFEALEPQGIGMLAINAGEGALAVEEFFTKISIDFPNVLGDADTLPNWSVRGLPTTIVVNAEGDVVYEALGPREWDDERLLQYVVDLL